MCGEWLNTEKIKTKNNMTQKPDLSFWKLWNLSFGFFGVQIAYALQSANISRILQRWVQTHTT